MFYSDFKKTGYEICLFMRQNEFQSISENLPGEADFSHLIYLNDSFRAFVCIWKCHNLQ